MTRTLTDLYSAGSVNLSLGSSRRGLKYLYPRTFTVARNNKKKVVQALLRQIQGNLIQGDSSKDMKTQINAYQQNDAEFPCLVLTESVPCKPLDDYVLTGHLKDFNFQFHAVTLGVLHGFDMVFGNHDHLILNNASRLLSSILPAEDDSISVDAVRVKRLFYEQLAKGGKIEVIRKNIATMFGYNEFGYQKKKRRFFG